MPWIVQSLLISVSLSMDAFAVSLSNGLTAKKMPVKYMILTALSFGLFQGIMLRYKQLYWVGKGAFYGSISIGFYFKKSY